MNAEDQWLASVNTLKNQNCVPYQSDVMLNWFLTDRFDKCSRSWSFSHKVYAFHLLKANDLSYKKMDVFKLDRICKINSVCVERNDRESIT